MSRFPARISLSLLVAFAAVAGCDGQDGDSGSASSANPAATKPASDSPPDSAATKPGGDGPAASKGLTEDDVKQFLKRKEENLATGVGSAHKSVTVEFNEVRFGATRKPNERDKFDGVRGDTVYPTRVKYKSIRRWGNGDTEEKVIHYAYDFYRDEFGEWNAVLQGPVR